jgi:hypothetical protein
MRVARNARCSFRPSPTRQDSNRDSRFSGFELSCGKQTTKQFSNRNKNGLSGISAPVFTRNSNSLRSYPFAQSRKAVRSRLSRVLPLEIAPRRLR